MENTIMVYRHYSPLLETTEAISAETNIWGIENIIGMTYHCLNWWQLNLHAEHVIMQDRVVTIILSYHYLNLQELNLSNITCSISC